MKQNQIYINALKRIRDRMLETGVYDPVIWRELEKILGVDNVD